MGGRRNLMAKAVPCHDEDDRPSPLISYLSHSTWRRSSHRMGGALARSFLPGLGLPNAAAHASTPVRRRPPQPCSSVRSAGCQDSVHAPFIYVAERNSPKDISMELFVMLCCKD